MNKYGTRCGFPPLKRKHQTYTNEDNLTVSSPSHSRRSCRPPRAIKLIVDGLGELKFKTVRDAAEYLGITTIRIYNYMHLGGQTPFPFMRFEYITSFDTCDKINKEKKGE